MHGSHSVSLTPLLRARAYLKLIEGNVILSDTFYLHAEKEGGFVTFSEKHSGAVGQGETEEEAAHDLMGAIVALKEFYLENPDW